MSEQEPPKLKLIALDAEDLTVISTCCQDALFNIDAVTWLASEKRFLVILDRFVWEKAEASGKIFKKKTYERRKAVLHFDQVASVQTKGISSSNQEVIYSLLSVNFAPDDTDVAGHITLTLANHCVIRLAVHCVEVRLSDLEGAWATKVRPQHNV